jgi:hypothetical protein
VGGGVSARTPKDWGALFGKESAHILSQNIRNRLLVENTVVCGAMVKAALRIAKHLRLGREGVDIVTQLLVGEVKGMLLRAEEGTPEWGKAEAVRSLGRFMKKDFVALPVDKNGGRPWVMCKRLFYKIVREKFMDTSQFHLEGEGATCEEASALAMAILKRGAGDNDLLHKFLFEAAARAPHAFLYPKNKSEGELIKIRILFSHFRHPGKKWGRVVGRALSLLIRVAVEVLPTWAILDIREVKSFSERVGTWLAGQEPAGGGRGKPRLFELDVKEMFPRLDRNLVLESIEAVYELVREALRGGTHGGRRVRVGSRGINFAVHKHNRVLDRVGWGYVDEYVNVSWEEVMAYVRYDLFFNDLFVVGNRIFRQVRGIAIGGIISAQAAELFCMHREILWRGRGAGEQQAIRSKYLPAMSLPLDPYRFRDNIVGLLNGRVKLARVRKWFEWIYGVELQIEGEGQVLPSLEAELSLVGGRVGLRLKRKVDINDLSERRIVRFPDATSVNAKEALRSIVVGLGLKCVWYSMSPDDVAYNITSTINELSCKGYPNSWWKPTLFEALKRQGATKPKAPGLIPTFRTRTRPSPPGEAEDLPLGMVRELFMPKNRPTTPLGPAEALGPATRFM